MTTEQKELLRESLLRAAVNATPANGCTLAVFASYARKACFRVTEEQLELEVQYLVDRGFLTPVDKRIAPNNKAWRITADGQDYAEANALI